MGPQAWAVFVMLILLIVIFVGFLNHFRAMYFGGRAKEAREDATAAVTGGRAAARKPLSLWCLVPMWMALIPLLALGLWWPQALTHYFSVIATQLATTGPSS
jgi:hydrogenase-4 component F